MNRRRRAWVRVGAVLALTCIGNSAHSEDASHPSNIPNRTTQILQMQLQSRTTRPPAAGMSGPDASRVMEGLGGEHRGAATGAPGAGAN